jgi:chromosome segregation ATPase
VGITILGGIGTIAYFVTKSSEQRPNISPITIQQLQTQASQLEQTLNQPQNLTKIHLKTKLTNLKGKIQTISQESNPEQSKLKQLEQEIKEIKQELGLPDSPNPPEETVDQLRAKAIREINDVLASTGRYGWAEVKQGDLFNN